jgi:hypothetical protein
MKSRILLLGVAVLASITAAAAEVPFKPYEKPRISQEQWTKYRDMVRKEFGSTAQEQKEDKVVMYFDDTTRTQYIFTSPGNPAHPGAIARRIVRNASGAVSIEQVGYFTGTEKEFAAWFAPYQRQNEQMRQPQ